jgi:hypothetical protein
MGADSVVQPRASSGWLTPPLMPQSLADRIAQWYQVMITLQAKTFTRG